MALHNGADAYHAYTRCPSFAGFRAANPYPDPWDIIKLFLPAEGQGETRVMLSRPTDKMRQLWVADWENARRQDQSERQG